MSSNPISSSKSINMASDEVFEENTITDENIEHEELLDEKENFFGLVIIKTRTAIYNQIKRVLKQKFRSKLKTKF